LPTVYTYAEGEEAVMPEQQSEQDRPCLHCAMMEVIDDFFAEYPTSSDQSDKVDTAEADEVIDAIAKIVAELTSRQDAAIRQQLIEQLTHEITKYDDEFRREDAMGVVGSHARH
jgi:DNA-directed RNA polymerase specialized sigma24 family protein